MCYSYDISGRGVGIRIKSLKKKVMETRKRKFIMSWVSYVTICSFLAVVNYMTCREYAWVLWVMGGWGLRAAHRNGRLPARPIGTHGRTQQITRKPTTRHEKPYSHDTCRRGMPHGPAQQWDSLYRPTKRWQR